MKTKIKNNRAIAVFDILGYKELVNTTKISLLPKLLKRISNLKIISIPAESMAGSLLVADTIVLYAKLPNHYGAGALIVTASNLFNACARHGIPLRGALTYGEVFLNLKENIISGKAFVKAFELEKQQEWCGALVDPEHKDLYLKGKKSLPGALHSNLVSYRAPLKKGLRYIYECIGWIHRTGMTEEKIHDLFFKHKKEKHEIYLKYQNTLEFFKFCYAKFPEEYRYLKQ